MSTFLKNILFAFGLALVLWLGYIVFIQEDAGEVGDIVTISQAQRDTQAFLVQLQELKEIDFSDSIFNDPRFNSLVDFRQDVQFEPVGRNNPFLPIGQ